jgi:hypothetical protein
MECEIECEIEIEIEREREAEVEDEDEWNKSEGNRNEAVNGARRRRKFLPEKKRFDQAL